MQAFEKLLPGSYYHVYNRGINGESLFREPLNYKYFLSLYQRYIDPIANTFAWCLMPNHFHFLIQIWDTDQLQYPVLKVTNHSRAFSNLFNSYAQAYNKKYMRTGGLFQTPFKRKLIESDRYFRQLVYYIHANPVKHGFAEDIAEYPWSSYQTFLSIRESNFISNRIIGWFDSKADFIQFHRAKHDFAEIRDIIEE